MINIKAKTYRNTVILLVFLILSVLFLFKTIQTYYGDLIRIPDSASHAHASDDAGDADRRAAAGAGDGAAAADIFGDGWQASQEEQGDSIIPVGFFNDDASSTGNNSNADYGAFDERNIQLLSAAGYDIEKGKPPISGQADNSEIPDNLSIVEKFSACAALYPNSPLSKLSIAVALDAPYNNLHISAYASSLTSAMLYAYRILDENEDVMNSLAAYADRPRRAVYLTIDDGPSKLTRQFLDILKARGIRATFFVVGNNIRHYPELIREMYEDGHCIANHSNTHNYDKLYQSTSAFRSEIEKCDNAINDALGFDYNNGIFRFPGGSAYKTAGKYKNEIKNMGYKYYDWNCLNGDAQIKDKSANSLYNYMVSTFKEQDEVILLMHDTDTKKTTLDMLERAIDFFLEKDYIFHTLDEK